MTSGGIGHKRSSDFSLVIDNRLHDASWPRAILSSIQEGVLVFDHTGLVLEMKQAFADMLGFTMAAGPILPPYPWLQEFRLEPPETAVYGGPIGGRWQIIPPTLLATRLPLACRPSTPIRLRRRAALPPAGGNWLPSCRLGGGRSRRPRLLLALRGW